MLYNKGVQWLLKWKKKDECTNQDDEDLVHIQSSEDFDYAQRSLSWNYEQNFPRL